MKKIAQTNDFCLIMQNSLCYMSGDKGFVINPLGFSFPNP